MDNSEVVSLLDKDPLSTDLLVSFLWAAATNYKHDTLVRPFPPQYLKGEHKDIELLVSLCLFVFVGSQFYMMTLL